MASATVTPTITTFRVQRPIIGDVSCIPYIPPGSASLQSQRRTQPSKARQRPRKSEPDANGPNRAPVSISADACVVLTDIGEDAAAGKGQAPEGVIIIGDADGGVDGDAGLDSDSGDETLSQIMDGWATRGETTTATNLARSWTGTQGHTDPAMALGDLSVERESAAAKDAGEAAAEATLATKARQHPQGGRGEAGESDQLHGADTASMKSRKRSFFGKAGSRSLDCKLAPSDRETRRQCLASSHPSELTRKRRRLSDQCTTGQELKAAGDAGVRSMSAPHTSEPCLASYRGESAGVLSSKLRTTGNAGGRRDGRSSETSRPSVDLTGSEPPAVFPGRRSASLPAQVQLLEPGVGGGDCDSGNDDGGVGTAVKNLTRAARSAEDAARASDADTESQPTLIVTDGAGTAAGGDAHSDAGIAANPITPRCVRLISTQSKSGSECASRAVVSHAIAPDAESPFQNRLAREGPTTAASPTPAIFSLQRTAFGVLLLSAVAEYDCSIRKSLHEQSVSLAREMLGEAISIEQLVMKPLSHGAWHLTAYVCDAGIAAAPSTATVLPAMGLPATPVQSESARATSALSRGSRPPRKPSRIGSRRPIADDTSLSDSDSSSDSDGDWPVRTVRNPASRDNSCSAVEDEDEDEDGNMNSEDDGKTTSKKRGRWTQEDEQRLRRCVESGMEWPKIAGQFPGRSLSAVKQHWGIMNPKSK